MPLICGGRVLQASDAGAVGANPPQESLRPTHRRGEATLESSRPFAAPFGAEEMLCSPTVQAIVVQATRGNSQAQNRGGKTPATVAYPNAAQVMEFLRDG